MPPNAPGHGDRAGRISVQADGVNLGGDVFSRFGDNRSRLKHFQNAGRGDGSVMQDCAWQAAIHECGVVIICTVRKDLSCPVAAQFARGFLLRGCRQHHDHDIGVHIQGGLITHPRQRMINACHIRERTMQLQVPHLTASTSGHRLRGPERDTLERHYLRGESVAAIASATGAAVGTVKARLSRGRRRLVLLCGAALSTVLAALALAPGSAGAKGARIHRATFVVEVRKPDAPCFRRVVLPLRSTADESADGWRIEGAWRIDDATEDTETGRLEPR